VISIDTEHFAAFGAFAAFFELALYKCH